MGFHACRRTGARVPFGCVLLAFMVGTACTVSHNGPAVSYPQTDIVAAVGLSIPRDRPRLQGGAGPPFTITPALPAGITLNADTGAISGRPQAESSARTYTVTASLGTASLQVPVRIAVGPAGSVTSQVLNCVVQIQAHSEWCGIASCASILDYWGTSLSQCELDNYIQQISYACQNDDFYWDDPIILRGCSNNFGPRPSETDTLTHFGATCTGRYAALTFDQIKEEIDADRPFMIHWLWELGVDDHNLVGMGWDESDQEQIVVFMDPMVGIRRESYDWLYRGAEARNVKDQGWHVWDKTMVLDP
jgi:hypothetical protein